MTTALRLLGLDRARWSRVGPGSLWPAVALAVGAAGVMALNRFGGLIVHTPRAFVRLSLIGIYGWLGLALLLWLLAKFVGHDDGSDAEPSSAFPEAMIVTGLAHTPMLALGIVIFVVAGLLPILGPGLVVAVFVLGFWFPATLASAARYTYDVDIRRAVALIAVPYAIWLVTVGRHLLGQVQHLL